MPLRLHNVRTRQKEAFTPLVEGKVGMYVCGLTVYDHMHIGHARTAVSFEIVRRWLERSYGLRYVQNVTDVDDKIIVRARELGVSPLEHAAKWDSECRRQSARLGVRPPDEAPHATTSIEGIVAFVQAIVERSFAYATEAGNVYFDVPRYDAHAQDHFPGMGYGSLSRRDYREMAAGTRKDVEADKRHPADFALWKAAKPDEPEDAQWDSPWGRGRPGWHIECSHMSTHTLGSDRIDIHGGGQDLIFPHHENEIAQSQAKTGQAPFVNVWMHTGFLNVEGQKMSKSLGNYITLKDMLDELEDGGGGAEALRFYFSQTHYRSKIDFSRRALAEAAAGLERLHRMREVLREAAEDVDGGGADRAHQQAGAALREAARTVEGAFDAAMDDDIHTPGAVAALFAFTRSANAALEGGAPDPGAARDALAVFEDRARVLTLFQDAAPMPETPDFSEDLRQREEARAAGDWATADAIRDRIAVQGFVIEDTPKGPRVRAR